MFTQDDEHENDRDNLEDADLDDENSEGEEGEDNDNDDEDEGSDDDESDKDSEEDDDKPVTRKELRELLQKNGNKNNAKRRVTSKNRNTSNSSKTEERLSSVEKFTKDAQLNEQKRSFGYDNNLSPKQTDFVFKMTKRPTAKFIAQPHIKAALDTIAQQSNVRANTPSGNGRTFKSNNGKSWEKMDESEKQGSFAERRRAILESKRGR